MDERWEQRGQCDGKDELLGGEDSVLHSHLTTFFRFFCRSYLLLPSLSLKLVNGG